MFRWRQSKQVAEHQAKGETERIFHEIKQVLRVTGVNLNFRTWAGYQKFFPALWEAMAPNARTRAFEDAADRLRADAVRSAERLGRLNSATPANLGESQAYQLRAALDLYHYINPKLLVFTSAVCLALRGEPVGKSEAAHSEVEYIESGIPSKMVPMEMVSEETVDKPIQRLFRDIKKTLSLSSINSDYRTLALWPSYLSVAWERLKPITKREDYRRASDELRITARSLARTLPHPVFLSRRSVEKMGQDGGEILRTSEGFEQSLPSLILNIALFQQDWHPTDVILRSPYPAKTRRELAGKAGGAL